MGLGSTVSSLLNKAFGNSLVPGYTAAQSVTVKRLTTGTVDSTGSGSRSESSVSTTAFVQSYTLAEVARSGGAILAGDLRALLQTSATLTDLTTDDQITLEGVDWRVVSVARRFVDGSVRLLEAQLRR